MLGLKFDGRDFAKLVAKRAARLSRLPIARVQRPQLVRRRGGVGDGRASAVELRKAAAGRRGAQMLQPRARQVGSPAARSAAEPRARQVGSPAARYTPDLLRQLRVHRAARVQVPLRERQVVVEQLLPVADAEALDARRYAVALPRNV